MTKHIHHDRIVEWAADTSRVVQVWSSRTGILSWSDVKNPSWFKDEIYRLKPEPAPDVAYDVCVNMMGYQPVMTRLSNLEIPTLRLTFDGETLKLKAAEILR